MVKKTIEVDALKHAEAKRKNIPTAEFESVMREEDKSPVRLAYERRNRDLDPQLVWRGKDEQDWSDLVVQAPPLYIQEKVHPKVIIDDLKRETKERAKEAFGAQVDLFGDFNGLKNLEAKTEFYQHDQHWSNRMITGDSLSVMASLAEREGLRGQVQCIYFDPPYGIKFNSNFQWSTTSRDVKDGAKDQITREPEQVRAFRDTWRDGIHSYLTYLRDRLTVARDLLHESGSIFVQIGDENVHRVHALMDEVFGEANFISLIKFRKTSSLGGQFLDDPFDYILWFARSRENAKYRPVYLEKKEDGVGGGQYNSLMDEKGFFASAKSAGPEFTRLFRYGDMTSQSASQTTLFDFTLDGQQFPTPRKGGWKTNLVGMNRLAKARRLLGIGRTLSYVRYFEDFRIMPVDAAWGDTVISGFADPKIYVVQTTPRAIQRCILMTTDPGDLVLDPTCGSGTSAYVAEQWGRRWITIDTSRVAIALARSRLMGARYPYYLLTDSPEGQRKEGEVTRAPPKSMPTRGDIRHGFVYERVPHITLKSIANNVEIDVIWEKWQKILEPLRKSLNEYMETSWEEWEIPREPRTDWEEKHAKLWRQATDETLSSKVRQSAVDRLNTEWDWNYTLKTLPTEPVTFWEHDYPEAFELHQKWWKARVARQKEIDASIAAKAGFEYLYDKPYPDNSRIRVAGPFTVESLSPHRTLAVDWNDELVEAGLKETGPGYRHDGADPEKDFAGMILEQLRAAGVQQAHKEDRIAFTSLAGWPGNYICAEGTFREGERMKRAGIFIGPEFGTVSRPDLVGAAREAGDAGFDVLIACAFNYDAHSAEFDKLGRVPVLKARMNPDLHMSGELKATGAGNLFVIFGEPDIKIENAANGMICVKVFGVDVFKPQTGEVISEGTDGIALWMLDTDYNEESFFVRHAYFLGANDPYKALKSTLKAEIDQEAWESLYSDISRPFPKPKSGRIAVKVINHLGDEVMKVFGVG
jgi:adenine-specific DNA-methyltransferase